MVETTSRPVSLATTLKRYATLAYGTIGTMLDVGLLVLGSLLIGLAMAVLLGGLELVAVELGMTTGPMLVSAIVLAVVGLFCVGLVSEGPLGRGRRLVGFGLWELGIGRSLAAVAIGLVGLLIHGAVVGILADLPQPFQRAAEGLRVVSVVGATVMPLLGVPLSLLTRHPRIGTWARLADIPVLFLAWMIASLVLL